MSTVNPNQGPAPAPVAPSTLDNLHNWGCEQITSVQKWGAKQVTWAGEKLSELNANPNVVALKAHPYTATATKLFNSYGAYAGAAVGSSLATHTVVDACSAKKVTFRQFLKLAFHAGIVGASFYYSPANARNNLIATATTSAALTAGWRVFDGYNKTCSALSTIRSGFSACANRTGKAFNSCQATVGIALSKLCCKKTTVVNAKPADSKSKDPAKTAVAATTIAAPGKPASANSASAVIPAKVPASATATNPATTAKLGTSSGSNPAGASTLSAEKKKADATLEKKSDAVAAGKAAVIVAKADSPKMVKKTLAVTPGVAGKIAAAEATAIATAAAKAGDATKGSKKKKTKTPAPTTATV